ncbi:hypothetical protein COCOBI_03-1290 [Coccomyxa sp. Obi]|nr:hypothetical protein COCOBI_03-1290 [Coccomyxa sp. Obi]
MNSGLCNLLPIPPNMSRAAGCAVHCRAPNLLKALGRSVGDVRSVGTCCVHMIRVCVVWSSPSLNVGGRACLHDKVSHGADADGIVHACTSSHAAS